MTQNAALVLATDEAYFPFACIVARQAMERASRPLPVVVIHDNVSEANLERGRTYCPGIVFADASHHLDGNDYETGWLSRATFIRLYMDRIPELDPFERVLYTDCDVSILADPWRLLSTELKAGPVAAAYDLKFLPDTTFRSRLPVLDGAAYFNAGVLLFDLAAVRAGGELEVARNFALEHPELCLAHDQDALNVAFQGRWQVMDWRWNAVSLNAGLFDKAPFIRHFTGRKPWRANRRGVEPRFVEMWRAAILNSPWPDRCPPESSLMERFRYELYPYGQSLERFGKNLLFTNARTPRGNRVRLLAQFPQVLARIETAAAEGRLAERYPETALLA